MAEQWRDIPGYEGVYLISTRGRIRSLHSRRGGGHILAATVGRQGYPLAHLSVGGVAKVFYVHRLMAVAFLGATHGELTVNHKNSARADNRIENLEVVTIQENIAHSLATGSRVSAGGSNPNAKLSAEDVTKIRARIASGESMPAIARDYGVDAPCIFKIKHRRTWANIP